MYIYGNEKEKEIANDSNRLKAEFQRHFSSPGSSVYVFWTWKSTRKVGSFVFVQSVSKRPFEVLQPLNTNSFSRVSEVVHVDARSSGRSRRGVARRRCRCFTLSGFIFSRFVRVEGKRASERLPGNAWRHDRTKEADDKRAASCTRESNVAAIAFCNYFLLLQLTAFIFAIETKEHLYNS